MGGRTSPPGHIWATSGSRYLVEGAGGGCRGWRRIRPGEGTGITGARAHPERGDGGDKGPSPSSVLGDLRDPPEGSHVSPRSPLVNRGAAGALSLLQRRLIHHALAVTRGAALWGHCSRVTLRAPVTPREGPCTKEVPPHRDGGDTGVLGGAPGAELPCSGKGHVPEGSPR